MGMGMRRGRLWECLENNIKLWLRLFVVYAKFWAFFKQNVQYMVMRNSRNPYMCGLGEKGETTILKKATVL